MEYCETHGVAFAEVIEYITRVAFGMPTQFEGLKPQPIAKRYGLTK